MHFQRAPLFKYFRDKYIWSFNTQHCVRLTKHSKLSLVRQVKTGPWKKSPYARFRIYDCARERILTSEHLKTLRSLLNVLEALSLRYVAYRFQCTSMYTEIKGLSLNIRVNEWKEVTFVRFISLVPNSCVSFDISQFPSRKRNLILRKTMIHFL